MDELRNWVMPIILILLGVGQLIILIRIVLISCY